MFSFLALVPTVYAMASKGLRTNHMSSYTEIEAGDELRKPLKPLLGIACVRCWRYLCHAVSVHIY